MVQASWELRKGIFQWASARAWILAPNCSCVNMVQAYGPTIRYRSRIGCQVQIKVQEVKSAHYPLLEHHSGAAVTPFLGKKVACQGIQEAVVMGCHARDHAEVKKHVKPRPDKDGEPKRSALIISRSCRSIWCSLSSARRYLEDGHVIFATLSQCQQRRIPPMCILYLLELHLLHLIGMEHHQRCTQHAGAATCSMYMRSWRARS